MHILSAKALQKSLKELNEEGGSFIWSNSLIYILCKMKYDESAQKEFINLSRKQYTNDQTELEKILDFENKYSSENAIWWYTKDMFVYRLLNKALRSEKFDVIFQFRSLIADIHEQLHDMHSSFIKEISQKFVVYRGQRLPMNEFQKIEENINGFISMNTFLSTTTDREVALMYSGNGEDRPSFESVLFVIETDQSQSTKPFANISRVSSFEEENEVLFTIGCIFQIKSVEQETPSISLITLVLVKHIDENIGKLTKYLNESIPSKPTLHDLNDIFFIINDYQRLVRFNNILLEQSSITDDERASIYLQLGNAEVTMRGNYNEAEKLYSQAEQILSKLSSQNNNLLISLYSSIGLLELERNNHSIGLESLKKARRIAFNNSCDSAKSCGLYSNLGLAYRNLSNYDEACKMYKEALTIIDQSDTIPRYHPIRSTILSNLAYTKQLQYQYDESLSYYNLALEIEQKILPNIHCLTATTLSNVALLHMMKDEYTIALNKYEQALEMFIDIYNSNHPRLATVFNNIGDLFVKMNQYQQAEHYLTKALRIRLDHRDNVDDNNYLAAAYTSLAVLYFRLKLVDKSLEFALKALDIRLKIPPTKTNNISITYMALAQCYLTNLDDVQALQYYKLARDCYSSQSLDFAILTERIADIFDERKNYDEAIRHMQDSIDMQLKLPNKNNRYLAKSYKKIGILYAMKGEFSEALSYFTRGYELKFDDLTLETELNLQVAKIYCGCKEFGKSSNYLQIAKSIVHKIDPVNYDLRGQIFGIQGLIHSALDQIELANQNLTDAVTAFQNDSSELSSILCQTYRCLAMTLLKLDKFDKASELLEKIKKNGLAFFENDPLTLAGFYRCIATILRDKNRLEQSLSHAEHALATIVSVQPIDYYLLSNTFDLLSTIHRTRKDFRQARIEIMNNFYICHKYVPSNLVLCQIHLASIYILENCMEEAIQLLNGIPNELLLSARNYSAARLSKDIAFIYNSLKQYQSSLRMTLFALNHIANDEDYIVVELEGLVKNIYSTVQHTTGIPEHINPILAGVLNCFGEYYLHTDNSDATIEYFGTALHLHLRYQEPYDCQLDSLFNHMDQLYLEYRVYDQYEQVFGKFMKKLLEQNNHKNMMKIRILLAFAHAERMDRDQTIRYCESAIKFSLNMPSPDYKIAGCIYNHISDIYIKLDNKSEFLKAYSKAIEMISKIEPADDTIIIYFFYKNLSP